MKTIFLYLVVIAMIIAPVLVKAQITNYPYFQEFEYWIESGSAGCGSVINLEEDWVNDSGDGGIDWNIENSSTPTGSTGPGFDHTLGYSTGTPYRGTYLYTEASSCYNNAGNIISPEFDFSGLSSPELRFWYHMYGSAMGSMAVQASTDSGTSWSADLWTLSGDQGDVWSEAVVDLSSYASESSVYIRIIGTTGTSYRSDMAVDDFYIREIPCTSTYTTSTNDYISHVSLYTINDYSGADGYHNNTLNPAWNPNADLAIGETYVLTVNSFVGTSTTNHIKAWIDWNFDGDMDDTGEEYDLGNTDGTIGSHELTVNLTVPSGSTNLAQMRISVERSSDPTNCGGGTYGETEDYLVNIVAARELWTGAVSTAWNNTGNWSSAAIPGLSTEVTIPGGLTNYPVVDAQLVVSAEDEGGTYICKSLVIKDGASLEMYQNNDMEVFSYVSVEKGGSLLVGGKLTIHKTEASGGDLFIVGGTVANNYESTGLGIGEVYFYTRTGGFMNNGGNLTVFEDLEFEFGSKWKVTDGEVVLGGSTYSIDVTNSSSDVELDNLKIDENVSVELIASFTPQPLDVNGDFVMESGSNLTINTGASLNVGGDMAMKSDADSTASLVESGNLTVSGTCSYETYLEEDRWHYVASPMSGQQSDLYTGKYLKYWDEPTQDWIYITALNYDLTQGTGYAAWDYNGDFTITYTGGDYGQGTFSPTLSYTASGDAFNLVGNPYPSAIDWDDASWTKTNIDGTIYVYDGTQNITWNGSIGALSDGIIPAGQAFAVKANSASPVLGFADASRVIGVEAYKDSEVFNLIEMYANGNGFEDKAFINFREDASQGFDNAFDGYKRWGIDEAPQLYTIAEDINLAVNVLPEIEQNLSIPVGYRVGVTGEYTIEVSNIKSFIEPVTVYLEDLKTGEMINVNEQNSYVFAANPEDDGVRFMMHFVTVTGFTEDNENSEVYIYSNGDNLYVRNTSDMKDGIVTLYDITGSEVLNTQLENITLNKLNINTLAGYYVVKVTTENNVYSEKVFIK